MKPLYMDYEAVKKSHGDAVAAAVRELQALFTDGLPVWFAGLWDDGIGGFYYSNSARDNIGFLPDIESTAQALGNLKGSGLVNSYADLPLDMAKKASLFVQGLQDPDDGFFYHPQWGKNITTSRRARDHGNALGIIRQAGDTPLYTDAVSRMREEAERPAEEVSVIPEHMRSTEAFGKYLDEIGINGNSYSAGHRIGAQSAQISAAGLTDMCVDFLNSHQYENGLWEKNLTYQASNGLMKISCAYRGLGRIMPRLEEALDASIKITLIDELPDSITGIYNTFFTIENVFKSLEETGDADLLRRGRERLAASAVDIIMATKRKLEIFKKADGSFSYCPCLSAITSQGALASLGANEGDVNATVIAIGTRRRCLTLLGIADCERIYSADDLAVFSRIIAENAKRGPFPKKKPLNTDRDRITAELGKEISDTVASLNSIFTDGLVRWIGEMWDGEHGGFYYSRSARDNEKYLPDVESTAQALGHLINMGVIDSYDDLPEKMRERIIGFILDMQDAEDGYFYHPQWGKDINTSRRGRDLGNATALLGEFGVAPKYPTALDRLAAAAAKPDADSSVISEHLRSADAFRKYLTELDLPSDPYPKGHILAAQVKEIKAAGLADICIGYLNSHQLENGMWSKDMSYLSASGLLKISAVYQGLGAEFPRLDRALESAIRIALNPDKPRCLVSVYNPILSVRNLLDNVKRTGREELVSAAERLLRDNARLLIKVTKEKLAIFMKPDGSFSYNHDRSTPISQKVEVSLGLDEGDMNAVALADSSRSACLSILGIDPGVLCTDEARADFFRIIEEKIK